jgi:hypothetical protein
MVVGVMRDNVPELTLLWGPTRHLDYARTTAHDAHVCFCRDVVLGNLPSSITFDGDWLVTESLELLPLDAFEVRWTRSRSGERQSKLEQISFRSWLPTSWRMSTLPRP